MNRNYLIYSASYLLAIALVIVLLYAAGFAAEPGWYMPLAALGLVIISLVLIYFINIKMQKLSVPAWYQVLNLAVWCVLLLVFGIYYSLT